MKPFTKRPVPAVHVVKPDRSEPDYEFWYLQPTCVGKVTRDPQTRVIRTDDGKEFKNVFEAAAYLESKNEEGEG